LLAARAGKRLVTMSDFESAKDKVMMGVERRSMVMTEEEKRLTAYHEAGHAVIAWFSPASDPIHKATIIPRGRALGMVIRLPEGDRISVSREKLETDIAVAMGGRVAEEQVFGRNKVTAGAASDIEQATRIARHMVTQWGMSDILGPVGYAGNEQEVFLGHSVTQTKNVSEATAQQIDAEIRRIVEEGHAKARSMLGENRHLLDRVAQALLDRETLTGEDIGLLLRGQDLPPMRSGDDTPTVTPASGKRGSVPSSRPARAAAASSRAPSRGRDGVVGTPSILRATAALVAAVAVSGADARPPQASTPAIPHRMRQCSSPTGDADSRD
jgi:cell division protease FtsH